MKAKLGKGKTSQVITTAVMVLHDGVAYLGQGKMHKPVPRFEPMQPITYDELNPRSNVVEVEVEKNYEDALIALRKYQETSA